MTMVFQVQDRVLPDKVKERDSVRIQAEDRSGAYPAIALEAARCGRAPARRGPMSPLAAQGGIDS